MLRTLLCTVVALFLVAGVSEAAKKKKKGKAGKPTLGKFVSFTKGKEDSTLKITPFVRKKKKNAEETKLEDKEIKIDNGTPVIANKDGQPDKGTSPEAFEKVEKGTEVRVYTGADGKVTRVVLGAPIKKKKKKKKAQGPRPTLGKLVSFTKGKEDSTLKITPIVKKKKKNAVETKLEDREIKIENGTRVITIKDGQKDKGTSPEAFENVEKGTQVRVSAGEDGKVTRVVLGAPVKKKKKKKAE